MSNEEYLIVSYFIVGVVSLGLALVTYLLLQRSFHGVIKTLPSKHFFRILRNLFLMGIVLPALFGFFSVSFYSCSRQTYEEIIAERAYLVAKNQEQLSTSLFYVVIALFVWGLIIGSALFIIKKTKAAKNSLI